MVLLAPALAGAVEPTPSETRLARAQVELDETAAALARARTQAHGAPREDRAELTRRQRGLQARKERLSQRVDALAAQALESSRDERDVWVVFDEPAAAADGPPSPAGEADEFVTHGVQIQSNVAGAAGSGPSLPASADALDAYLAGRTSPLAGLGATFVAESTAVGLDPRLLVAIAGAETSFGTYAPSQAIRNPFGLGPGRRYASWADAIRAAARNLAGPIYLGDGRVTISTIQQRWAPSRASNDPTGLNLNWTRNVGDYYRQLGGDPDAAVFADAAVPLTLTEPTTALPVGSPGELLAAAAVRRLGELSVAPDELVRDAGAEAGVPLDEDPAGSGRSVDIEERAAGDLLLIERPGVEAPHLAIYLGAGAFVHASPARGQIALASLREARFGNALTDVRRLVPGGS